MEQLKDLSIGENKAWNLILLFAILIIAYLAGKIASSILKRLSKRYLNAENSIQSTLMLAIAKSITLLLVAVSFSILIRFIPTIESLSQILKSTTQILFTSAIAYLFYNLIEVPGVWFEIKLDNHDKKMNKMFIPVIRRTLQVTVVVLTLIQIFQILSDKPITSIIAGLGIGGLAVALAAGDTLKHFFGSISIMGDKPFNIGDRIVVDTNDGVVEEVGLRSTRIRTLDGHLLTYPNGDLAMKAVKNISERPNIKRTANITITYDTPREKILEALEILRSLLKNHEGMHPDFPPRVHFNEFNADSLNILVIYWYHPAAYWDYLAFTERLNLQIFEEFEKAGIEFAFPTQTIHLAGNNK